MPTGRKPGTPKTGGRTKGTPNKATVEVEARCRALIESDEYIKYFEHRLSVGQLPPALEAMTWHYAYGKPPDSFKFPTPDGSLTITWKS